MAFLVWYTGANTSALKGLVCVVKNHWHLVAAEAEESVGGARLHTSPDHGISPRRHTYVFSLHDPEGQHISDCVSFDSGLCYENHK